ncbi:MAG: hypothetical protein GY870_22455 [archaeon]|nr:hypothetical protein [archaeon]
MGKKNVYVPCKKCGKRIRIQLDRDLDFSREDHIYTLVHAHGELGEDAHALIMEVDRNLNIRNTRVSDDFIMTFDI